MMRSVGGILVVIAASLAGGAGSRPDARQASRDGHQEFQRLYQGVIADAETFRAGLPCHSISVELSGGLLVGAPSFMMTLQRDGRATLRAAQAFGRTGRYAAIVDVFDFGKLCHLIAESRFLEMRSRYEVPIGDLRTWTVAVATASGVKTVEDYGGAGPVQLWAIQRAATSIAAELAWQPD
jgi:hypothetical protein